MTAKSLVIIGAPRSGTNMLRDVLTRLPGFATWPCDEINYIWRHGNVRYPSDELPVDRATPRVVRYIRGHFDALARRYEARVVVEKTCANSLRVPFVDKVVNDARYVFIYRDGVDVVGSALKRWTASLDPGYLAKKARYVPISDLPYYASRYAWNRVHKLVSRDRALAVWGPRVDGMADWPERYDLLQMCAMQWRVCVEKASRDLAELGADRVHQIRYEDFVANAQHATQQLARFLDEPIDAELVAAATDKVSSRSIGRGRDQLSADELRSIRDIIAPVMDQLGYD